MLYMKTVSHVFGPRYSLNGCSVAAASEATSAERRLTNY